MNNRLKKEMNNFLIKNTMDKIFLSMLPEDYMEINVQELIDKNVLERCGYFEKNPDYIQCVLPIRDDEIPSVMKNKCINKEHLAEDKMMFLSPAACLPIYPMLQGENIEKNLCITTKATAFRNEKYYKEGVRHYQFSIREFIFIGEEDYVMHWLDNICDKTLTFAKKITDNASIEDAVDYFYPTAINKMLKKYQKAHKAKRELVIKVDNRNLACASFNYHDKGFSKKFCFDNDGRIVSGCVGFGFERLLNAYEYYGCNFING